MKTALRFFFPALFAAVAFTSCGDDPQPGPTPQPTPGENEYGYAGQIETIRSVYAVSNDSQTAVLISPQADLKTYRDFTADGVKYLLFQMDKTLDGTTVDVKTETAAYRVENRTGLAATLLTQFDQTSWSTELGDGSFRIAVGAQQAEVDFTFTLLSGEVFRGKYKGTYVTETAPAPTDFYAFDGSQVELKSVVTMTQGGMIYMYMSPVEGLTAPADFTDSDNYLLLGVAESLAGQVIDVTSTEDGWAFYNMTPLGRDALETLDPYTWEDTVSAGTMLLTVTGQTATASFSFNTLDGGKLFSGLCSGQYEAPLGQNNYTFDGQTIDLKSAFHLTQAGLEYLYISPQEGLTTIEEFAEAEYLLIGIDPSLEGQRIDVLASDAYCAFFNMTVLGEEEFTGGDSDSWGDILTQGELSLTIASGRAIASFSFTLPSGKVFEGSYAGPYSENTVPEDAILFLDGNESPVRAAFYEKTADGVAFYLTPGAIESARELEDVLYYVRLYVGNALLNQQEVDIETTNRPFEFTYVDNLSGEHLMIENGDTQGAAGYFTVTEQGENRYTVEFEMDGIGDHMIAGLYDGEFAVYDLTVPNQYALEDETPTPIRSALLDRTDASQYAFYFSGTEGVTTVAGMQAADPVICYLKPDQMTGSPIGFSFSPDVRIVYKGVTYDQSTTTGNDGIANGGNIAATLDGNSVNIDFTIFFIKEYGASLKGHYAGTVVLVD